MNGKKLGAKAKTKNNKNTNEQATRNTNQHRLNTNQRRLNTNQRLDLTAALFCK